MTEKTDVSRRELFFYCIVSLVQAGLIFSAIASGAIAGKKGRWTTDLIRDWNSYAYLFLIIPVIWFTVGVYGDSKNFHPGFQISWKIFGVVLGIVFGAWSFYVFLGALNSAGIHGGIYIGVH